MENREILIASTKTQQRYHLNTNAVTLGELKTAMDNAGIDYSGMSFTEGISNVQLNDDNTQLPHDVSYKGKLTNNLVIILTNTVKNIKSGMMSRKEAYEAIVKNGLQDKVKQEWGKNYTTVPTADLIKVIEANSDSELDNMADDVLSQYGFNEPEDTHEDNEKSVSEMFIQGVAYATQALYDAGVMDDDDIYDFRDIIESIL